MGDDDLGMKPKRKRGPGPHSEEIRQQIFDIIHEHWPIHPSDIVEHLGRERDDKSALLLAKYHIDQLARQGKIKTKKIGQSVVTWPQEIEKLRVVHDLMRGL